MRKILLLISTLCFFLASASNLEEISRIGDLIKEKDLQAAKKLALSIKEVTKDQPYQEENFRVNYLLGYIYKEEGDFGKAIIYYLESIRIAEHSDIEFRNDLISLYNRCAIIYRQFKAYDLAYQYYNKGIALAKSSQDVKMQTLLNFNLATVLIDNEQYDEALNILNVNLINAKSLDYKVDDYYNRIASVYLRLKDFENALLFYDKLKSVIPEDDFEMQGYLYHNMALAYEGIGNDRYETEKLFHKSIELKKKHHNKTILFSSYFDLGRFKFEEERISESLKYFDLAIDAIENNPSNPLEFKIYKYKADALFLNKEYTLAKEYEDVYASRLNQYLDLQEEIQDSDKRYNMDLITKRYFDEVEKQERIASILLYSKLISGTLLTLLLFSMGYNWYQKTKLRRSIVRELIDLRIID